MFLNQKYTVEGLSLAQIAKDIRSSKSAVRGALLRFKIPLRTPHRAHGKPAQLPFGKRLWGGRVKHHPAEQKVIDTIAELKAQGMGLRQIARTLTKLGVPTKCQAKSWHPEMVKRILQIHSKNN